MICTNGWIEGKYPCMCNPDSEEKHQCDPECHPDHAILVVAEEQ